MGSICAKIPAALATFAATALLAVAAPSPAAAAAQAAARSAARPMPAGVQIRDAWIRWLPAQLPEGGYLTLVNDSSRPVRLTRAASPDYAEVSLHQSQEAGGISRMVPVAGITVAAHSVLDFARQGYHIMLMHPRRTLAPGGQVPVTLTFADDSSATVSFALRPPDAGATTGPAMPGMKGMAGMSGMSKPAP